MSVLALNGTPFITPMSALVLQHADGRWLASYDPYTAAQNLPAGVSAATPGSAHRWQFDSAKLASLRVALLGHNTTPEAEVPTWKPAGLYSDWLDEHDVSHTGMILMNSAASAWTPTMTP